MTTIRTDRKIATMINVFSVQPANQQHVLDLLIEMNDTVYRLQPGYLTANFHKSLDGVKIINYSQWRTEADLAPLLSLPALAPFFQRLAPLCDAVEPHMYAVVAVDEAATA